MRQGRKISGGKYKKQRKKKLYEKQGQARIVKLGSIKRKQIRTRGGKLKTVLLSADEANIIDKKAKKSKKAKIKNVLETPSNRFLARQNILLKGAIIETDLGKAKITNRPSQEGSVQAVLTEEKKEKKEE
jgi:small subunit ribosomal protein S8e